jgi:hypothetical protein
MGPLSHILTPAFPALGRGAMVFPMASVRLQTVTRDLVVARMCMSTGAMAVRCL